MHTDPQLKITTLLTCHNRREKTHACLQCLATQDLNDGVSIRVVLVDDGSTDGTAEAVAEQFPDTQIIQGTGNLFWCGGMRLAWDIASKDTPDYYLLANDDTHLDKDAVQTLLEIVGPPEARTIAVAAIRDPHTGVQTYGGIRGTGVPIVASGELELCDTFNGNAVLISRAVFAELGSLHKTYTHAMGDYDYGYHATRSGISILQSRRSLGSCEHNEVAGSWRDRSLPRLKRLRILQGPKGLPFREWVVYNRRNSGWIWPVRCISPFIRILLGQ